MINHALHILANFGIPIEGRPRRIERMAIVFLALADVKFFEEFASAKDLTRDNYYLKTREIIEYANKNLQENISMGSYDDIRRKDLKLLVAGGIVLQSSPSAATNDSTRGYGLNPDYAKLARMYPGENWEEETAKQLAGIQSIAEKLSRKRQIKKIPVKLPFSKTLEFSPGAHNDLQKAVIEEFLPRYGHGARVLYVGDTADKFLHLDEQSLRALNFFEISHEELPDIIAFSSEKNWIFLIEAVHSSGPISEIRLLQLKKLTKNCTAPIIYVTACLDKATFRKFMADIAWETEVWIAADPDHLIHFDGEKFLGPYAE